MCENASSTHGGIMPIRQLGFGILAVLAIAVTFGLQPEEPELISTSRFDGQVQQALADFDANESRTAGAPQHQVVVNGRVNRDLLTIISRQLSASMEEAPDPTPDPRVAYLLLILVLTVGWHGATSRTGEAPALAREPPEPVAPAPDRPEVAEPDAGISLSATDREAGAGCPHRQNRCPGHGMQRVNRQQRCGARHRTDLRRAGASCHAHRTARHRE